jgi:hypothetical protein
MEQIKSLYQSHGYPGADKLFAIAKAKGISVKLADVKSFVAEQTVAQLHKAPKKVAETPITVDGKDTQYQMDLLDYSAYARNNGGNSWILVVENIWDRRAAAVPCKTKSPKDVLLALQQAIKDIGAEPLQIVSDSGTEWMAGVKTWMKERGIFHRTVEIGDHNSLGIIDNFAKFIKNSLGRHFTHSQKTEWLSYLPTLIKNYNDTPHSSLKAKGDPAMSPNEAAVKETDTRNIHVASKQQAEQKKRPSGLALHDHVRILKRKQVFDRGYSVRYSKEVYTIEKIDGLWYELSNGKRYREGSLQKVSVAKGEAASDLEERKEPEIKDVQREAKFEHKTEQILKHKEGVAQSNRREGLRERAPSSQLVHSKYGQIRW